MFVYEDSVNWSHKLLHRMAHVCFPADGVFKVRHYLQAWHQPGQFHRLLYAGVQETFQASPQIARYRDNNCVALVTREAFNSYL